MENVPDEWFTMLYLNTVKGGKEAIFINEPGLYHLIFRSNKPKAREFANWVCSDVLPEIRKNGFFGTINDKQRLDYSKQISKLAIQLSETKDGMLVKFLVSELRTLCNLVGQPMPELHLLHTDFKQLDMFKETGL